MSTIEALSQHLSTYLTDEKVARVKRAYYYAEQAHEGQNRQSGEHYVTHPLAVACILGDMHMDHQSLMAAMLHDVIEDTGIPKKALVKQFGKGVADLVDGVSKLTHLEFETKKEEQAENFQKMALAMAKDIRVILVKLADRLHNMRTLGALRPEKKRRIARETLDIYSPIASRLGINVLRIELEDLAFEAIHPNRCKTIRTAIKNIRGNRKELVAQIEQALANRLAEHQLDGQVQGREKHLLSIYNKMRAAKKGFNEIMDVYAFRITTDTVDSCYRILGAVHNFYKPIPNRFKDYIAIPKANGYQSLHTTLIGMNGVPIEIQIRTHEMEAMADNGIAGHWLYKANDSSEDSPTHARARRWVKSLLEMQQRAGNPMEFIENVKGDLFPDEIYVFSPKGRILELPKGATAVDFAYAIHTDVGNSCVGCEINQHIASLSDPLESGDTIKIKTVKGARPNPAWLNYVATGKARSNIRHFLKNFKRQDSVELGKKLLNSALAGSGTDLLSLSTAQIESAVLDAKFNDIEDLLEDIGLGNRMAFLVAKRLLNDESIDLREDDSRIALKGSEGMVISYAKCCRPIPGDPIVGVISAGKGMVVHIESCNNINEFRKNPDKVLPLTWDKEMDGEFIVDLRVDLRNARGALANIASAVAQAEANIESIHMEERDDGLSRLNLSVSVEGRIHMARVMKRLRNVQSIFKITRIKA